MTNQINHTVSIFIFLTILLTHYTTTTQFPRFANAGKIHITDELDDVIDDEEDDDWKNWGKKRQTPSPQLDLKPSDLDKMEPSQIQAEMMKHNTGPLFGFIKLRLGVRRTPDEVSQLAMKWTKVSKTGGLEVKFMGVDLSTLMFTMEAGQHMGELKEFMLEQPDAYEVKIGDNVYRRPGDPPLEEVIEMLRGETETDKTLKEHDKDEL
ncbi:hypothetical protein SOVF_117350 [Spinacia oleracea]|uniref:Mesoderm development candidate 2 n=1 Tax=Spinacia oleracea TaxID=3562 RepID=A0A9R0JWZ9_SPIOL|nr:uncharacterized protein LOC110789766 [Spinacia oleracea]KNA13397.1 hypothetical protein SOVF_117350 [Spinacia oleracea]